jgi:hypothetical protein
MRKTRCAECGHKFSDHEALCDDWRDPEKALGCPRCETFFVRVEGSPEKRLPLIGALFGAGIMYPAASILFKTADDGLRASAVIILLSSGLIAAMFWGSMSTTLKRSSWTERRKTEMQQPAA